MKLPPDSRLSSEATKRRQLAARRQRGSKRTEEEARLEELVQRGFSITSFDVSAEERDEASFCVGCGGKFSAGTCKTCQRSAHWERRAVQLFYWADGWSDARGRPKVGMGQPWAEVALLARILAMDRAGKRLLGEQLVLDKAVNRRELARRSGIPKTNLYRWIEKVGQNTISEEKQLNAIQGQTDRYIQLLDRLEESVTALEQRFPGNTAVSEAVDRFLESVPGSEDDGVNRAA